MERLSIDEIIAHCERETNREDDFLGTKFFEERPMNTTHMKRYWEHKQVAEYLKELKAYRDAEEQGLLLRLPCKVGDTVYNIIPRAKEKSTYVGYVVERIVIYDNSIVLCFTNGLAKDVNQIGKTIFLTEKEVEQELKQMGE